MLGFGSYNCYTVMLLQNKININVCLKLNERSVSPSYFAIVADAVLLGCHVFVVSVLELIDTI